MFDLVYTPTTKCWVNANKAKLILVTAQLSFFFLKKFNYNIFNDNTQEQLI